MGNHIKTKEEIDQAARRIASGHPPDFVKGWSGDIVVQIDYTKPVDYPAYEEHSYVHDHDVKRGYVIYEDVDSMEEALERFKEDLPECHITSARQLA